MTTDDALVELAQSTTEAIGGVLEMFAPGQVAPGGIAVVGEGEHGLEDFPVPTVATMASYVDGVGANLFLMTVEGARRLAAAMMGTEPDATGGDELSELELSAVAEAMSQIMASAAAATSAVLGTEVEVGAPETRSYESVEQAIEAAPRTPHATRAAVSVCGEQCRLVQLIPDAFVELMSRARDEPDGVTAGPDAVAWSDAATADTPSLAGISVRLCAELGRARMPSAQIVGLPTGAVVELDRQADEPIDLYVNGMHLGTGRLIVDGDDWAVRIETILDRQSINRINLA